MMAAVPEPTRIAERTIAASVGAERVLARALRGIKADTLIFDCPPSMGVLTAAHLSRLRAFSCRSPPRRRLSMGLVQVLENLRPPSRRARSQAFASRGRADTVRPPAPNRARSCQRNPGHCARGTNRRINSRSCCATRIVRAPRPDSQLSARIDRRCRLRITR